MERFRKLYAKFIPILFLFSIVGLVWRRQNTVVTDIPKAFEGILLALFLLVVVHLIISKFKDPIVQYAKIFFFPYGIITVVLLLCAIGGNVVSVYRFPSWIDNAREVVFEYIRIIFVFLFFFITAYFVSEYKKVASWILGILAVSPLVLFLAYLPSWQDFLVFKGRLIGFEGDPNYLAVTIGLGILISLAAWFFSEKNLKWLGLLGFFLYTLLFVWANSRGASVALGGTFLILMAAYLFMRGFSLPHVGKVALTLCIGVIALALGFLIIPRASQFQVFERNMSPFSSYATLRKIALSQSSNDKVAFNEVLTSGLTFNDRFVETIRGNIWKAGTVMFLDFPLGLGPASFKWNPVGGLGRAHNTYLEIGITAGWIGFLVWLALLIIIFLRCYEASRSNDMLALALSACFVYLLLNMFFLDMFTFRWLWLIMGTIVGYDLFRRKYGHDPEGQHHSPHV